MLMEDEAQHSIEGGRRSEGWNVDTLREYMLRIIADQGKAVEAALVAADLATAKAEAADGKRFDSVNEFRQTLSDQTQTFIPREEVTLQVKALHDKIDGAASALRSMTIGLIALALTTGISVTVAFVNLIG